MITLLEPLVMALGLQRWPHAQPRRRTRLGANNALGVNTTFLSAVRGGAPSMFRRLGAGGVPRFLFFLIPPKKLRDRSEPFFLFRQPICSGSAVRPAHARQTTPSKFFIYKKGHTTSYGEYGMGLNKMVLCDASVRHSSVSHSKPQRACPTCV